MRLLRCIALLLIALIPLCTLVHRNDVGRWDVQRSAMAGPDEFSYLLMADNFLHGHGLALAQTPGHDTFYPPGYPVLMATWTLITGAGALTAFTAHALNATLLCCDTLLVYFLSRRLLAIVSQQTESPSQRFALSDSLRDWIALLIAGIFATNWHVLETALLIMSEPAFMLVTFAWILLLLRWPRWHLHPLQALIVGLLAVCAWSIRGAGLVLVATTILYSFSSWLHEAFFRTYISIHSGGPSVPEPATPAPQRTVRRLASLALLLLLPLAYQLTLLHYAPEKSLTSPEQSANSYPRQLLQGLTDGRRIDPSDPHQWPRFLANLRNLIFDHLDDFAATFVPWPREHPDMPFRILIGKLLGLIALIGWIYHTLFRANSPLRCLDLFLLLYFGLYLVWPFDFARFWSPVMPLMLVYAVHALTRFFEFRPRLPARTIAAAVLALLFTLSLEEDCLQLGNYARRLNYVSDCVSDTIRTLIRHAPDAHDTVLAVRNDDLFMMAWYLPHESGYILRAPDSTAPAPGQMRESVEEMLRQSLQAELRRDRDAPNQVFLFSYFGLAEVAGIISNLHRSFPQLMDHFTARKIYQKEIITALWQFELRDESGQTTQSEPH